MLKTVAIRGRTCKNNSQGGFGFRIFIKWHLGTQSEKKTFSTELHHSWQPGHNIKTGWLHALKLFTPNIHTKMCSLRFLFWADRSAMRHRFLLLLPIPPQGQTCCVFWYTGTLFSYFSQLRRPVTWLIIASLSVQTRPAVVFWPFSSAI